MKEKKYLIILQVFRGIAALMVVIHHSVPAFGFYYHWSSPFADYIAGIGKLGVDFFFVLSGFIISYSASGKASSPGYLKTYLTNRFIRIYLPYLPIGIAMYMLYACFPGFSDGNREISLLTSLTLIPVGNPALSVAWTLSYEIMFYLLFSLYFLSERLWKVFVCFWMAMIVVVNCTDLIAPDYIFNLYNLEFMLGYGLSLLVLNRVKLSGMVVYPLMALSLALFLLVASGLSDGFDFSRNLLFSAFVVCLIYSCTMLWKTGVRGRGLFMLVGNASYSIYLVHNPLISVLVRIFKSPDGNFRHFVRLFLVICVCVAVGYLYYLVFEKALMKKAKHLLLAGR